MTLDGGRRGRWEYDKYPTWRKIAKLEEEVSVMGATALDERVAHFLAVEVKGTTVSRTIASF